MHSLKVHAIGVVVRDGQQDFHTHPVAKYINDQSAAVAEAKTVAQAGRRIFLRNIDTGRWTEIPPDPAHGPRGRRHAEAARPREQEVGGVSGEDRDGRAVATRLRSRVAN
jgi:hypothetical protein